VVLVVGWIVLGGSHARRIGVHCGGMNPWGSILGVWAHPDDETYASAAHMMRALADGDRVVCLTATTGEQGSPDEVRWPPGERLAKVRTAELEAALDVLGVTEHEWLGYPDGECAEVPLAEGSRRVLDHLEAMRPATVLTFGPDGNTGHPDHIAVSRWVDEAVARFDGPRPQVLWTTDSDEWMAVWREYLDSVGALLGNEPVTVPRAAMRSHLLLSGDELDRKVQALLCQTSQVQSLIDAVGMENYRSAVAEEDFR
jgi:LmbE family N-acetylglucosaminyl deacetylase